MNAEDTEIAVASLDSIATSLETLTRIAVFFAARAGCPVEVIAPPEADEPT